MSTPETDAQCYDCTYRGDTGGTFLAERGKLDPDGDHVSADFARELEHQRDESRRQHIADVAELNDHRIQRHSDMMGSIVGLRAEIAKAFSAYCEAVGVTTSVLQDVKKALRKGVAHSRSELELSVFKYDKRLAQLTFDAPPSIKTNVRLFDLVRFMRSELHEAQLISDDEYAWLCSANPGEATAEGSPSRERLETYDEMRAEIARLKGA